MKDIIFTIQFMLIFVTIGYSQYYEIELSPTISTSKILESNNGISNNTVTKPILQFSGYQISISTYTKPSKFQFGLNLKNEYITTGGYIPIFFPQDIVDGTESKLKINSHSLKLGIGGILKANLKAFAFNLLIGYDVSLSNKTSGIIELGYSEENSEWDQKKYTVGKGPTIELKTFISSESAFEIGLVCGYKFYRQRYYDEEFKHDWVLNPLVFGPSIKWKLNSNKI